jgi:hypothetical protein
MVSIEWCLKQKNGIELVASNENVSESYLSMAEESVNVLSKVGESNIWTGSYSPLILYGEKILKCKYTTIVRILFLYF